MKPGDLVTLGMQPGLALHSDWCWQLEDSDCHQVDTLQHGEIVMVLAIVTCGWPSASSKQLLVLTPRCSVGWNSPVFFDVLA